ncbi:MAG: hypothetical protein V1859_11220 [archaeon]
MNTLNELLDDKKKETIEDKAKIEKNLELKKQLISEYYKEIMA